MPERGSGALVLDTHVWIWMVEGVPGKLSASAIRSIERASRVGAVFVSAISVWEVAMLWSKGRLALSQPLDEWVQAALTAPGVRVLPLAPEIAIDSARLPGGAHGDPADRILIASARHAAARLATCDAGIVGYAELGHVRVLDARLTSRLG